MNAETYKDKALVDYAEEVDRLEANIERVEEKLEGSEQANKNLVLSIDVLNKHVARVEREKTKLSDMSLEKTEEIIRLRDLNRDLMELAILIGGMDNER